ncbi:unnamed protein product, partial [Adineta ricciae]
MEAEQQDSARPSLHTDTLQLPNSHEIEISDRQRKSSVSIDHKSLLTYSAYAVL